MKKKILIGMVALLIGSASFFNFGSVTNVDAKTTRSNVHCDCVVVTPNYNYIGLTKLSTNDCWLCPGGGVYPAHKLYLH